MSELVSVSELMSVSVSESESEVENFHETKSEVHVRVRVRSSKKSHFRTRVRFGHELMFELVSVSSISGLGLKVSRKLFGLFR